MSTFLSQLTHLAWSGVRQIAAFDSCRRCSSSYRARESLLCPLKPPPAVLLTSYELLEILPQHLQLSM